MFRHERTALERLARQLRRDFGTRVTEVVAFGSRVRGDHGPESDLDLLIVVDGKTPRLEEAVVDRIVDVELETGVVITPVIKDRVVYARERELATPFFRNVSREGLNL